MDRDDIKRLYERYTTAKYATYTWRNSWTECARYSAPGDYDRLTYGLGAPQPQASMGRIVGKDIIDDTAMRSLPKGAAALNALLTPDTSIWHNLLPLDDALKGDWEAMAWYEEINRLLFYYRNLQRSNWRQARMGSYGSVMSYGNGVMYVDNSRHSPLRYRACFIGDVIFDTDEAGMIDKAYRLMIMKLHQLLSQFGEEALPQALRDKVKKGGVALDEQVEVIHAVCPNNKQEPGRIGPEGMAFSDVYFLIDGLHPLKESGHKTFPYIVDRYNVAPTETYGRGPVALCMPSILTLQRMKAQRLKHSDRTVDPVLFLADDGQQVSMIPGAKNYGYVTAEGRPMVTQLQMGSIGWANEDLADERRAVEDAMFVTFFRLLNERKEMTATEVLEALKEKGALYVPMLSLMQDQGANALIDRELSLLIGAGLLPPPPPAVVEAGLGYRVDYDNPVSKLLKAGEATAFARVVGQLGELSNLTQDPSIMDSLNFDEAVPEFALLQGAPRRWLNRPEQIAAIRAGRQQQQETEQLIKAAPAIASTLKVAQDNPA